MKIPKNLDFPKPQKIGKLSGVHGVSSDNIVIVDAQTLLIPAFSYDGEAPGTCDFIILTSVYLLRRFQRERKLRKCTQQEEMTEAGNSEPDLSYVTLLVISYLKVVSIFI